MSIITRALSAIGLEKRSNIGVNGWPMALSASTVTTTTAQGVSAVYACVQAISETAYSKGNVLVRAMATVDVAVRHPESFVVASDVAL